MINMPYGHNGTHVILQTIYPTITYLMIMDYFNLEYIFQTLSPNLESRILYWSQFKSNPMNLIRKTQ